MSDKPNENQIDQIEHDDTLQMKKVMLYGWDGTNAVKIKTTSAGEIIINPA